jgi:broad specificity phosphatase PhoE
MTDTTVVHLLRHGEVHNPESILYGRLPGFHLSEDGVLMAKAVAKWFTGRPVKALFSSPMDRAQETAAPLAETFDLPATIDERLVEAANSFEGLKWGVGAASLRRPETWRLLRNPFRPSWGEPYEDIARRMHAAAATARDAARGAEAVCVSHQLPIWIARCRAESRRLWHHPGRRECTLASVTSFTYAGDRIVSIAYHEPAAHLNRRPSPPGA